MHRIEIESDDGNVIICDARVEPVSIEELRLKARTDRYLCLSAEEEVAYDIGIELGGAHESARTGSHASLGGFLGLSVPSGKLLVTSFRDWSRGEHVRELSITPGEYLAEVKAADVDHVDYREQLIERIGADDVRHSETVGKLGLWSSLFTMFFAGGLFLSVVREHWHIGATVAATGWLSYFFLTKSRRYRRIEEAEAKHIRAIPRQLVVLQSLPEGQSIPGGHVRVP